MANFEIDDRKLEKERQKMEKEERKLKLEQEKALKQQNRQTRPPRQHKQSDSTKFEKYKNNKTIKKKIFIGVAIVLVLIAIILSKNAIANYVNSVKEQTSQGENEVVMVDIIGFDIDSAKEELEKNEISYKIIYSVDEYNIPGNVIKTDTEIGNFVNKDIPIKVYVCENGVSSTTIDHNVKTQETPLIKDNIDVLGFSTDGDNFSIVIQNNNSVVITSIEYSIGYVNNLESAIGFKTYKAFDLNIQPGEKYILTNKIKYNEAYSLTIEGFKYEIAKTE